MACISGRSGNLGHVICVSLCGMTGNGRSGPADALRRGLQDSGEARCAPQTVRRRLTMVGDQKFPTRRFLPLAC